MAYTNQNSSTNIKAEERSAWGLSPQSRNLAGQKTKEEKAATNLINTGALSAKQLTQPINSSDIRTGQ
jgi:hypothetical protein